jgi:hypothetical protein
MSSATLSHPSAACSNARFCTGSFVLVARSLAAAAICRYRSVRVCTAGVPPGLQPTSHPGKLTSLRLSAPTPIERVSRDPVPRRVPLELRTPVRPNGFGFLPNVSMGSAQGSREDATKAKKVSLIAASMRNCAWATNSCVLCEFSGCSAARRARPL